MNKLPWFTHDHDAHEDGWIRNIVRTQGHVAGWIWWVLLELLHKHGTGDVLKRDINDVARACLTSASVLVRVLTQMATEYEGQTKLRWALVGTELQLEIKKFRERQGNLKSKTISKQPQNHPKTSIYIEEERERHNTPLPPKGDDGFDRFWKAYPNKKGKLAALKAWNRTRKSDTLKAAILEAVEAQKSCDQWTRDGGQYIPHPATWLNQGRWADEVVRTGTNYHTEPALIHERREQ